MNEVRELKIEALQESPYQGRFLDISDKALLELVRSIETSGLLNPIVVRPCKDDAQRYEIIDGHRRVAAFRALGRENIPAIVADYDDRQAQVMSIVGNLQRKNLSTIELALAYEKLLKMDAFKSRKELSEALGKSETYVGDVINTLRMDSRIVEALTQKDVIKDLRILRAIRKAAPVVVRNRSARQWELFTAVVEQNLNRAGLAKLLKQSLGAKPPRETVKFRTKGNVVTATINLRHIPAEERPTIEALLAQEVKNLLENYAKTEKTPLQPTDN